MLDITPCPIQMPTCPAKEINNIRVITVDKEPETKKIQVP